MATVYVVEPDDAIRDALEIFLQSLGYCVHTFACADEFLQFVGTAPCGWVVVEAEMPGRNGLRLLSELQRRGSDIPVILIVNAANSEYTRRAMLAGASAVLEKPLVDTTVKSAWFHPLGLTLQQLEHEV